MHLRKINDDLIVVTVMYSSELKDVTNKKEGWEMDLVIEYDPKADILAIKLKEEAIKDEKPLDSDNKKRGKRKRFSSSPTSPSHP